MRPCIRCLLCLLLGWTWLSAGQRGQPPHEGIVNYGLVRAGFYRGAKPDGPALDTLQRLGVRSIIDLRMPREIDNDEARKARMRGIAYTNVPLPGLRAPTDQQVQQVLTLLRTLPGPVYLHCEHGCDRTGTIVACSRMQEDHWAMEPALREAEFHGLSGLERGMRRYIQSFPARSAGRQPR